MTETVHTHQERATWLHLFTWLNTQEGRKQQKRKPIGLTTPTEPKPLDGYRELLESVAGEVFCG